jgi:DNA/RNA endonuclease YhcR with UshA esterase domain
MDLIKIAITVAIVGIVALFLIVKFTQQDTVKIASLKEGEVARVSGTISSVYISKDSNAFIKMSDETGEISIVAFKSSNIDLVYSLAVGDQIEALGKVQEYKGALEIIAKEIKKI